MRCVISSVLLLCLCCRPLLCDASSQHRTQPNPSDATCEAVWSLPHPLRASLAAAGYPPPVPVAKEELRIQLFILFLVDPPILLNALRSLCVPAGVNCSLALPVQVIDTSASRLLSDAADAATADALKSYGVTLVTPSVREMGFNRAQNLVQDIAFEARLHAFYILHSDAAVTSGAQHLLNFAARVVRAGWRPPSHGGDEKGSGKAGVVFFSYDALALFSPAACLATGLWDTNFIAGYGADVDFFHRMRTAGFATTEGARWGGTVPTVTHEGSHGLHSGEWACARRLRMDFTFEGEWRGRYLERKWGAGRNGTVPFVSSPN